jgi:hypothetical protein
MELIFLAYGFSDPNKLLVREIDTLCFSHGIRLITGEILGGARLEPAVQRRIRECDALIALATREVPLAEDGAWETHQWVRDEFGQAVANALPAVAIVERGVRWRGMYREHERIDLDRDRPSDGLLGLAKTIGYWRQTAGRRLKVRLDFNGIPPSKIDVIQYRCLLRDKEDPWCSGKIILEPGGAYLFIRGVKSDDHAIEVEARTLPPVRTLRSVATPQVVSVQLSEV